MEFDLASRMGAITDAIRLHGRKRNDGCYILSVRGLKIIIDGRIAEEYEDLTDFAPCQIDYIAVEPSGTSPWFNMFTAFSTHYPLMSNDKYSLGAAGEKAIARIYQYIQGFGEVKDKERLKEVRRSSVDGLARKAVETVGREISAVTGLEWFRSAYGLRRCLLHRGGIVGQEDVDDDGLLTAVWRRPILSVDGKHISALPFYIHKGGTLGVRLADEIRSWHVDDRLQLTAQNCQNIGVSLAIFAGQTADELRKGLATMLGPATEID